MRLVTRAPSHAEGFLLHGSIPYEHGSGHKYQESDQSIDRSRDLGKILDWGKENGTSGGELFWVLPAGYRRHGCCWRISAMAKLAGENEVVGGWAGSPSSRLATRDDARDQRSVPPTILKCEAYLMIVNLNLSSDNTILRIQNKS